MSDADVLRQMAESKANQRVREHINEGKELDTSNSDNAQALENYQSMPESEQAKFRSKGWKNG